MVDTYGRSASPAVRARLGPEADERRPGRVRARLHAPRVAGEGGRTLAEGTAVLRVVPPGTEDGLPLEDGSELRIALCSGPGASPSVANPAAHFSFTTVS